MEVLKEKLTRISQTLKSYKVLLLNFSYLSIIQVFNMLFPLLIYPYLIRVLGKDMYGRIVFAQAIMGYLVVIINFGFNITSTKEISVNIDNKEKINEIVSSTYIIKGLLFILSIIILSILALFISDIRNYWLLFYLTLWMCLYEFLFPIWYFQGTEKMGYITIFTLISRSFFLIFIFIFVHSTKNYLLVPIINGLGSILACIGAIRILFKNGIKLSFQPIRVLYRHVKSSYVMALAYASNSITTNMSIVIVKAFSSYSSVAYFDLANKITNICITFLDLISQAVFPKISRTKDKIFLRKTIRISILASLVLVFILQILAPLAVKILGGNQMLPAVPILRILCLCLPFYIFGAMLGRNGLFVHGYGNFLLISMGFSAIVYLLMVLLLGLLFRNNLIFVVSIATVGNILFEAIYRYKICLNKGIYSIKK